MVLVNVMAPEALPSHSQFQILEKKTRQSLKQEIIERPLLKILNSLALIEVFSINEVQVSSCSNIGSTTEDPYWISIKNSLELIELSSTNKVSLV